MSVTVDQVIERYTLDDRFTAKAKNMVKAAGDVDRSFQKSRATLAGFSSLLGPVGGGIAKAFSALAVPALAAGAAVVGFGYASLNAAADMDSLKRALESVAGSSQEAKRQFDQLREVAKGPALGFQEAIRGSLALQGAGLNADQAAESLRQFGNALAMSGGGKDELNGVIVALAQMKGVSKVTADNINQIANAFYGIRGAMKEVFGTADSEEIDKMGIKAEEFITRITAHLTTLPRVTGGIRNAFDNLGDTGQMAFATIGDAIAKKAVPEMNKLADFVSFITDSGRLTKMVNGFLGMFSLGGGDSLLVKSAAYLMATFEELPSIVKQVGRFIVDTFHRAGKVIQAVISASFALLTGGIVFRAILALLPVIKSISHAMSVWKGIQAAIVAMVPNVGPAVVATALAIGTAVGAGSYLLVNEAIDNAVKAAGKFPDLMLNSGAINARADALIAEFAGYKSPEPGKGGNSSAQHLRNIAKNTFQTAKNTNQMVDLRRFGIGGGDLGQIGITPIEMRRARSGKPIDIRVTGADESLNALLSDFLRRALPLATAGRA
jgi:tape measure domain-containing protein